MYKRLFYKRVWHEWRQKGKTARSIIDWTIALYVVIPAAVFAGMYYSSLWKTAPKWVTYVPLYVSFTCLFFLTSLGSVRSFLEQGDSLFLIQYPHIMRAIIVRGIWYTCVKGILVNGIAFLYSLPILITGYGLTVVQAVILFLLLVLMSFIQMFLNRYWKVRIQHKWEQKLLHFTSIGVITLLFGSGVVLLVKLPYALLLYVGLLLVLLRFLIRQELQYERVFFQEAELERAEGLRWTSAVLVGVGHVQKPVQSKKPWLFPRSKRLLKTENRTFRIVEAFLKDYFRTDSNLQFYSLVTMYSEGGIVAAPWWLGSIIFAFALFAIFKQSGEQWKLFADKMLLRLYCPEGERLLIAEKARGLIFFPALLVYVIVCLGILHIWAGIGAGLLAVSFGVWYLFFYKKKKESAVPFLLVRNILIH
jgi:ABC-2 type transport system permease protein